MMSSDTSVWSRILIFKDQRHDCQPLQASLIAMKINQKPGFYAMSTLEEPNPKVHDVGASMQRRACSL